MPSDTLYEERLPSKGITGILTVITAGVLFVLIYQRVVGPIGTRPAPTWFFLVLFLLFLGVTINFSQLRIRMTSLSICVRYGLFGCTIPWGNVEDVHVDQASGLLRYGGWGIRVGRVRGKWRVVYNVMGGPRVVLLLRRGRIREFVFSTRHPEEVINLIKQRR